MNRLHTRTLGPTDWRRLLGDPEKHWVPGKSALECAVSWEAARTTARGLPPEILGLLDSTETTVGAELLLGLVEHQVDFEGGGHPSQTDLWALLRGPGGLVSMACEAKSGESFGQRVGEWIKDHPAKSGKPARLAALRGVLGLREAELADVRYQLLHRTASALKEAERFGASVAVMVVQAFGGAADESSLKDFECFARLMGAESRNGGLACATTATTVPLYLGWASCAVCDLATLRNAV